MEEREATKRFAYDVWHQCFNEFYEWEPLECSRVINNLRHNVLADPSSPQHDDRDVVDLPDNHEPLVLTLDFDSAPVYEHDDIRPCPRYESCTLLNENLWQGKELHLEFVPFSDYVSPPKSINDRLVNNGESEKKFDIKLYKEGFKTPFWYDKIVKDVDSDMILAETLRRIYFNDPKIVLNLDGLEVLPANVDDIRNKINDRLMFDCPTTVYSQLPPFPMKKASDILHERLLNALYMQCNVIGCSRPACPTHGWSPGMKDGIFPVAPTKTKEEFITDPNPPCGPRCYKFLQDNEQEIPLWKGEKAIDLYTLLVVTPDLLPCDLAILLQADCREVHINRWVLYGPLTILNETAQKSSARLGLPEFDDSLPELRPAPTTCFHTGPCDASSKCECVTNSLHCQRACRCAESCVRRLKGCECHIKENKGRPAGCSEEKCACWKAKRECDPTLCHAKENLPEPFGTSDRQRNSGKNHDCRNISLQKHEYKQTEVRRGSYGWGLFITEKAEKDDLIGEYVGEILHGPDADHRLQYIECLGRRNYQFNLDNDHVLDSVTAGNEIKFINTPEDGKSPNCEARSRTVNDVTMVGIYARKVIRPGTELLFSYGNIEEHRFFKPERVRAEDYDEYYEREVDVSARSSRSGSSLSYHDLAERDG